MSLFDGNRLAALKIPLGTAWLMGAVSEMKGKQELYKKQSPHVLETLREMAIVESAESSNRIEGVTVEKGRLIPLVMGKSKPRDRSEEEIAGYRQALNHIHQSADKISIDPKTFLNLHRLTHGASVGDAGQWKERKNDIVKTHPNGRREVVFSPPGPAEVPALMKALCVGYRRVVQDAAVPPLIAVAALVLEFLCVHPFRDGNGRISRLATLLALYHHGFEVGRYVSLERIVEQTKESYYDVLRASSKGWHQDRHDPLPWINYFLGTLRRAYREFEEKAGGSRHPRGSKTGLIENAVESLPKRFSFSDVQGACPSVGRDLVRLVLNRLRAKGRLRCLGRGRSALWEKCG